MGPCVRRDDPRRKCVRSHCHRFHAPQNHATRGLIVLDPKMTDHPRRVTRALLSVSDKSGLVEFARALTGHGVELVSTGGTAKAIAGAGLKVRDVSELTGFPEMMDGRVKTLHPKVHGGLLAIRDNAEHAQAMKAHGIAPIDLLVVNLYPFEATVEKGAGFEECIENIDIGGPAMIRAAAKNHDDVAVIVEAQDYQAVLDELAANKGATTLALRRRLAAKAYARTAAYDAAVSNWLALQPQGAGLRLDIGLWRYCRTQPHARRRRRARHHRDFHRSDHRARRHRGGHCDRWRAQEFAAVAGGRPARSVQPGRHRQNRCRRPSG